jgi:uncharacterized protein involved in outer membrane biogenesis
LSKRIKYSLIGIVVFLVLILIVPFFIPTSAWLGPLQDQASKALGTKVLVGDLRLAFAPLPHLTASKIDIGEGAISVESVTVYPEITSLFSATRKIRSVNAEKLVVTKRGTELLGALAAGPEAKAEVGKSGKGAKGKGAAGKGEAEKGPGGTPPPPPEAASAPPVEIGKLRVRDAQVELASGKLPPIDLDAEMDGMTLVNAKLSVDGGKAKLDVEPKGDGWDVLLNASNWTLPVGAPLKFDSLKAAGRATKQGLTLPDIAAKLYGGELKGKVDVNWPSDKEKDKPWRMGGNAAINGLDIGPALQALKLKPTLSGRLDASGPFSAQAASPALLADVLIADFAFNVRNGVLHGFDLASAATNLITGAKGGQTHFDQLSGNAQVAGKGYKLRNVRVASGALSAQGNVDIAPSKALGGRVDVELKRTAGVVAVPLAVSGTLSDPMLMPTKGAIAGAVAGSVLLPGVGTAAGASVGDKLGKFFGGK